ncbi:hypothetical protein FRX31_028588 [Thalictrum thalictroides]|uniref:Uncharacterized protein n=1 Tax=Thalictrum thalictroides TaxID=46969 RepID=A0A7J6V9R5_THATH|nr:hypothetical protein FRX31_028588 [Thalictrum thalictroides]
MQLLGYPIKTVSNDRFDSTDDDNDRIEQEISTFHAKLKLNSPKSNPWINNELQQQKVPIIIVIINLINQGGWPKL